MKNYMLWSKHLFVFAIWIRILWGRGEFGLTQHYSRPVPGFLCRDHFWRFRTAGKQAPSLLCSFPSLDLWFWQVTLLSILNTIFPHLWIRKTKPNLSGVHCPHKQAKKKMLANILGSAEEIWTGLASSRWEFMQIKPYYWVFSSNKLTFFSLFTLKFSASEHLVLLFLAELQTLGFFFSSSLWFWKARWSARTFL